MSEDLIFYGFREYPEFFDAFCRRVRTKGIGPQDVTALLLQLLRSFFSNPDNFKNESLKERVYREGSETGIVIESVGRFTPELAEKRPAIFVKRNEWALQYPGISANKIFDRQENDAPWLTRYVIWIAGSHVIITIGKTLAETEVLAEEVFKFLLAIQPLIIESLPFMSFRILGISEPKLLKEGRDHFFTSIVCRYTITESFTMNYQRSEA